MPTLTIDQAIERANAQHERLHAAVAAHLASDDILPGLILLYSAIDGAAWLASLAPAGATIGDRFRAYVRRYVLRGRERATVDDLWAARCGILHTQTPESDLARRNAAREIFYNIGDGRTFVQRDRPRPAGALVVKPTGLAAKWNRGWRRFIDDVRADLAQHNNFIVRVESLMNLMGTRREPPAGTSTVR